MRGYNKFYYLLGLIVLDSCLLYSHHSKLYLVYCEPIQRISLLVV